MLASHGDGTLEEPSPEPVPNCVLPKQRIEDGVMGMGCISGRPAQEAVRTQFRTFGVGFQFLKFSRLFMSATTIGKRPVRRSAQIR